MANDALEELVVHRRPHPDVREACAQGQRGELGPQVVVPTMGQCHHGDHRARHDATSVTVRSRAWANRVAP